MSHSLTPIPRRGPAGRRFAAAAAAMSLLALAASSCLAAPTPMDSSATSPGAATVPPATDPAAAGGGAANSSRARADAFDRMSRGDAQSDAFVLPRSVDTRPPMETGTSLDPVGANANVAAQGTDTLKQMAVATRDWVHEVLPWTRGSAPENPVPVNGATPVDGARLELPIEAASSPQNAFDLRVDRRPASTPATANPANAKTPAGLSAAQPGAQRHDVVLAEEPDNLLRRVGRFGQALLTNPLTWLAVVLVAAMQVVKSRIRRRRERGRR